MPVLPTPTDQSLDPPPRPLRPGASLGDPALAGSGDPYDPPPPPRTPFTPRLSSFALGDWMTRPAYHEALDAAAPEVAAAWRVAVAEAESLRDVVEALELLPSDERREQREHARLAHEALEQGKPVRLSPTGWAAKKASLEAERTARHERASQARENYVRAVEAALPSALAALAGQLDGLRAEALEAWRQAEPAIRRWRSAVAAADAIAQRLRPDDLSGRTTTDQQQVLRSAVVGMDALGALLTSTDPVLTGSRHADADGDPMPDRVRRALAEGSAADRVRLGEQEYSENYAVSSYTRAELEQRFQLAGGV